MKLRYLHHFFCIFLVPILYLTSCLPEDRPYKLLPTPDVQEARVVMGTNYDKRIYFDLETVSGFTAPTDAYDLAFENTPEGNRILLNGANFMKAFNTQEIEFDKVNFQTLRQTPDSLFCADYPNGFPDSLVLSPTFWRLPKEKFNTVYILDRGRQKFKDETERFYKFQLLSYDKNRYVIKFGKLTETTPTTKVILKDKQTALRYLDLSTAEIVELEPAHKKWDIVFTRYTHVYKDQPLSSAIRYYSVTGGLINNFQGVKAQRLFPKSPEYIPFDSLNIEHTLALPLKDALDTIGFDWKDYDFEKGFITDPKRLYIIKTVEGNYYKLRFLDFLDEKGNKGSPYFEFQQL
ncbi:MAG: HmuY family protein [Bacteroidia bacterium]|nr:hypothetical protein [Bacteroidia bacterium]MDW8159085.1 HmuY family protein [Bacteroidia bacterium]